MEERKGWKSVADPEPPQGGFLPSVSVAKKPALRRAEALAPAPSHFAVGRDERGDQVGAASRNASRALRARL